MKIVVAPDKFKGSLNADAAARAIARGLSETLPAASIACIPMADGGEGTVDSFLDSGAQRRHARVHGPLGAPADAVFAIDGETAIVEMASASGLSLVPMRERDPMRATTFGTGELLLAALDARVRRIVIGIGGSATNDGGAGMLTALGARLLDDAGEPLALGGAALSRLAAIDLAGLDPRLGSVALHVACDVDTPLLGSLGATATFAAQKGAAPSQIDELERGLERYAAIAEATIARAVRALPGSGAAGGTGFGLALLGAQLGRGVDLVAEVRGLPLALEGAALCITGEGRIDAQTLAGKVVDGVARLARARGVRVVAFAGAIDAAVEPELWSRGIAAFPIVSAPVPLSHAVADAEPLLAAAAARLGRVLHTPTDWGGIVRRV